jgi:hypothetical protein
MSKHKGWLSPMATYYGETGLYQIRDGGGGDPIWTIPGHTGTLEISTTDTVTIPATDDHSSGITRNQHVYDDLGTLVAGQTYRAGYFRYNVKSTTPGNPVAEVTGLEGVAGSAINDEALTFRGGYFRTYIDTDTEPLASMRTNIGVEISARAAYSGGVEATAESGTAFVGARIWMAPFFTDASLTNINNFHALWIINEAAGKIITNAIKIDSTTYNGGFRYSFYTDDGKFYLNMDGNETGNSFAAGATSSASGETIMHVQADDYRTLTTGQEYKAGYFRYNIYSTTPSNPTAEISGVEGVVGVYFTPTSNSSTIRGGYFRTYQNASADTRIKTNVGCEISARASYSGGTECKADVGTAFVGARIWMAPFFDSSISNINNFHALWIVNEAAGKFVTNAIKIDSNTYNGGFTYAFYTDSGKFRMALDGSEAGSGLVKGETVTTSGDDWMSVVADDYRTMTSAQTYRAGYFRYNMRPTTPSNPTSEVTGIEGVVGIYSAFADNSTTARGGYFRTYIDANATYKVRTSIGCEISARAGYSGGTDCVADSGTAFVGARIWMAPFFSSGSVGNIDNFWGLWIYGEHSSQRNADAAIKVSDAGGGFTLGLDFTGANLTEGVRFGQTLTPDSGRTYAAYTIGSRTTEKDITMAAAASQNLDPVQINLNIIGSNPSSTSTLNAIYQKITHDTTDMANLRLKCADWTIGIGKNIQDAYVYQGEIDFTAGVTASGEVSVMGLVLNGGADALTCSQYRVLNITLRGAGTPAGAHGIMVNAESGCGSVDAGLRLQCDSSEMVSGIRIGDDSYLKSPVNFAAFPESGTQPVSAAGGDTHSGTVVKIAVLVGGDTYYFLASTAIS